MSGYRVPLIIRGEIIESDEVEYGGRRGGFSFTGPDVGNHLDRLLLSRGSALSDLLSIRFDEILDYLVELGQRLQLSCNPHMQEALAASLHVSGLSEGILRHCYETVGYFFDRQVIHDMVDNTVGIPFLEDWVETQTLGTGRAALRAFGARSVHVIAGNVPAIAALSIVRNAVIRSDAIIKTPSNDPLTATAIARTMIEMAPDHPITRHLSVAYWKGGDARIEERVYRPANVEKIIAWGGFASVSHISKYLQPGIDLITLDPKLSSTIVGEEAFASEQAMADAARLLALDIGHFNQEACTCARVAYIQTGTDDAGLAAARRFGRMVHDAIQALPSHFSEPASALAPALRDEIDTLKLSSDDHEVIGGGREGAIIVSLVDEPVDFARILGNRVANLVPVDDLEIPIRSVTAYTQTIGIYPEALKDRIRDRLALQGAQRLVSLGGAQMVVLGGPQDGVEPLRRMCKWISDERRAQRDLLAATADADSFLAVA